MRKHEPFAIEWSRALLEMAAEANDAADLAHPGSPSAEMYRNYAERLRRFAVEIKYSMSAATAPRCMTEESERLSGGGE